MTKIDPTAAIPGLDSRGWLGVTHAEVGGWRVVTEDETPLPSSIYRPAGSLATGVTMIMNGSMEPVLNGLRPTGEVFRRGEYSDTSFWHRLLGETEPISARLGQPRPCPVHGDRVPQVVTRESGLPPHTPWTVHLWTCQPDARLSELTHETRGEDGKRLRCAGRYVDAPTGRVLTGMGTRGATHVDAGADDPAAWFTGVPVEVPAA